jgi:hypothetical protein
MAIGTCGAGALQAQTLPELPIQYRSESIPLTGAYKGSTGGNFTGHTYPDVAFVVGNQVALLTCPTFHRSIHAIGGRTDVNDVGTLASGGANGKDALLFACTGGLFSWTPTTLTQMDTSGWGSAVGANLDGNAAADVVGRNRFATAVLIHLRTGTSSTTTTWSYSGQTVYAVAAIQWDGTGPQEVCVSTNQGLQVRNVATGTVVFQLPLSNTGPGLLTRVSMNGTEATVWLTRVGGQLGIYTQSIGVQHYSPYDNSVTPVGVTSSAVGNDLYGDLIVTHSNSTEVYVMHNQWPAGAGSSPFVYATRVRAVTSSAQSTANTASAWCGDMNFDGLGDFVMPITGHGRVDLMRQPEPDGPHVTFPANLGYFALTQSSGTQWTLSMNTSAPADATHLELVLFPTTSNMGALSSPVESYLAHLAPSVTFTVVDPATASVVSPHIGFVRFVQRSGTTVLRTWKPRSLAIFTPTTAGTVQTWAASSSGWSGSGATQWRTLTDEFGQATTGAAVDPPPPPPPPTPPAGPG